VAYKPALVLVLHLFLKAKLVLRVVSLGAVKQQAVIAHVFGKASQHKHLRQSTEVAASVCAVVKPPRGLGIAVPVKLLVKWHNGPMEDCIRFKANSVPRALWG
jgi:hypothetical protein